MSRPYLTMASRLTILSIGLCAGGLLSATSHEAQASCGDYVVVGNWSHADEPGAPCHGPDCQQAPAPHPPTPAAPSVEREFELNAVIAALETAWRPPPTGFRVAASLRLPAGHPLPVDRPPKTDSAD